MYIASQCIYHAHTNQYRCFVSYPIQKSWQPGLLDQIQDEIVYILEFIVYDYTGEAKSEISEVIENINDMSALDAGYRQEMVSELGDALNELKLNSASRSARAKLIMLRRKVLNTRLQILGKSLKYSNAHTLAEKTI